MLFGGYLPPNSDETAMLFRYWWGDRYPLELKLAYRRHGENIYDENEDLIFNAGGDPLQTHLNTDDYHAQFLAGHRVNTILMQLHAGLEIIRGFNIQSFYRFFYENSNNFHYFRIIFSYEDF